MDEWDKVLAALGLSVKNIVVGAVSSFVALRFFDGLTWSAKWTTFLGGWAISAWGAPPLREYLEASPKVELLFVLLLAFFGMAIASEIIKLIRDTEWRSIISAFLQKKGGGGKQ